jgi:formylglycine-generating enzyme required for sulfatase activity
VTLREGAAPQLPDLPPLPPLVNSDAAQEWVLLADSNDVAALKAFQDKYKDDPQYGKLVEQQLILAGLQIPPDFEAGVCKTVIATLDTVDTCLKPGGDFTDCDECPHMIVIPAGTFTMGSAEDDKSHEIDESPQHEVTFDHAFSVGKLEVTRGQYAKFVADSGYAVAPSCSIKTAGEFIDTPGKNFNDVGFSQTDDHPVACVSWEDAKAYTDWLSKKTGREYRLLSEAEWEYVARAGAGPIMISLSDGIAPSKDTANFGSEATKPAGSLKGNDFGLFDIIGNVAEWTNDCYLDKYSDSGASPDVKCDGESDFRVNRGGSYYNTAKYLRIAYRSPTNHSFRFNYIGFRVARTLP